MNKPERLDLNQKKALKSAGASYPGKDAKLALGNSVLQEIGKESLKIYA